MTDFEKACQKLPENGPNSKLSKCQVFEISYKSNERHYDLVPGASGTKSHGPFWREIS